MATKSDRKSKNTSQSTSGSAKAGPSASKRKEPHVGDRVKWHSSGGENVGQVEKKLTSKTQIKGHTAEPTRASPVHP